MGVNDADYVTQPVIDGKKVMCPAFRAWSNMLSRAYNPNYHNKYPTYKGVEVCSEWLVFSNFRMWFVEYHIDDFYLDKDILNPENNKVYSPDNCIFVPLWLNSFILTNSGKRGEFLLGVTWHKHLGKFVAQCCHPKDKTNKFLGYFKNENEAHNAWLRRKLEIALELKPEMDLINPIIYQNVVRKVTSAL